MTLISMLEHSIQHYGSKPALAHKPKGGTYQDISYTELGESVDAFSKGLNALGVQKGDRVALLSENRPEWAITDFGCLKAGAVTGADVLNANCGTGRLHPKRFRIKNYLRLHEQSVGEGNRYPR